jgi:hypothetical protein
VEDTTNIWQELARPLPNFRDLVRAYSPVTRQPGHDVSDEPRDESGKWTDGGGGGGDGAGEKPSGGEKPAADKGPGSKHWNDVSAALKAANTRLGGPELVIRSGADEKTVGTTKEGKELKPAAYADLQTMQIIAFPDNIASADTVPGILAHEIQHHHYDVVLTRYKQEEKTISLHPSLINESGYLKPQFEDKYPVYARLWKYEIKQGELTKDDGVTNYSKAWWRAFSTKGTTRVTAMHETMAEISRKLEETGKREGVSELWSDYFDDVQAAYGEFMKMALPRR